MPDHNGDCEAREQEAKVNCKNCTDSECSAAGVDRVPNGKSDCFQPKEEPKPRACRDCADRVCGFTKTPVTGLFPCFLPKKEQVQNDEEVSALREELSRVKEQVQTYKNALSTAVEERNAAKVRLTEVYTTLSRIILEGEKIWS